MPVIRATSNGLLKLASSASTRRRTASLALMSRLSGLQHSRDAHGVYFAAPCGLSDSHLAASPLSAAATTLGALDFGRVRLNLVSRRGQPCSGLSGSARNALVDVDLQRLDSSFHRADHGYASLNTCCLLRRDCQNLKGGGGVVRGGWRLVRIERWRGATPCSTRSCKPIYDRLWHASAPACLVHVPHHHRRPTMHGELITDLAEHHVATAQGETGDHPRGAARPR